MAQLAGADFFIGLSSGLSWLAWAVDVPVVMISGFTKAYNEFSTPYRIINESVCNGCWNDVNVKFDRADWFWCPYKKDFECSKQISVETVLQAIKKLISAEL
jgi:autotransporter strand-loop-strand O-heptosyltransferase